MNQRDDRVCRLCGERGHIQKRCPARQKGAKPNKGAKANAAVGAALVQEAAKIDGAADAVRALQREQEKAEIERKQQVEKEARDSRLRGCLPRDPKDMAEYVRPPDGDDDSPVTDSEIESRSYEHRWGVVFTPAGWHVPIVMVATMVLAQVGFWILDSPIVSVLYAFGDFFPPLYVLAWVLEKLLNWHVFWVIRIVVDWVRILCRLRTTAEAIAVLSAIISTVLCTLMLVYREGLVLGSEYLRNQVRDRLAGVKTPLVVRFRRRWLDRVLNLRAGGIYYQPVFPYSNSERTDAQNSVLGIDKRVTTDRGQVTCMRPDLAFAVVVGRLFWNEYFVSRRAAQAAFGRYNGVKQIVDTAVHTFVDNELRGYNIPGALRGHVLDGTVKFVLSCLSQSN